MIAQVRTHLDPPSSKNHWLKEDSIPSFLASSLYLICSTLSLPQPNPIFHFPTSLLLFLPLPLPPPPSITSFPPLAVLALSPGTSEVWVYTKCREADSASWERKWVLKQHDLVVSGMD